MKYKYSFHSESFVLTLPTNADIDFDKLKNKNIPLTIIDQETGKQIWINLEKLVYMEKEVQDEENGS